MAERQQLFELVRQYLPNQSLTGPGITSDYLRSLLNEIGVSAPPSPIKRSHSKNVSPTKVAHGFVGVPELNMNKIGRASGRERVCVLV
jgi:hypothetical protein